MSKLMYAAIKLFPKREETPMNNFLNAMVNNVDMSPSPKITGTRIWFWTKKRWERALFQQNIEFGRDNND